MTLKPKLKILVVDDMLTMRRIIKSVLKALGFSEIYEAEDGSMAYPMIEKAEEEGEPFEFIISDWNMPKMDGISFLRKIRENECCNTLPFLMITAESDQSNVVIAVKSGVSNFIIKPFSAAVLKDKMEKILSKQRADNIELKI